MRDKAMIQLEKANAVRDRAYAQRLESMIDQRAGDNFEYSEDQDFLDLGTIQPA